MSKLSQFAGARNFLMGRLNYIQNNLKTIPINSSLLTLDERRKLNEAFIMISYVTRNQKKNYQKLKKEKYENTD
jgi:hypothetical protein